MRALGRLVLGIVIGHACCICTAIAAEQEFNGIALRTETDQSTDRIIVGWRVPADSGSNTKGQKLLTSRGFKMLARAAIDERTEVLSLDRPLAGTALDDVLTQLEADPDVAYASPDLRRHPHALTSDPLLTAQWYLLDQQPAATRTNLAWDVTTGSSSVIVAVLDTGVRFDHPDLERAQAGGKLLGGYDFVSNATFSNDGDGRDNNPSDPGDWVDGTDLALPAFAKCESSSSSWHGTRVSGIIGAATNNSTGIAGAGFQTRILPIRVMGKCGGFDSDIIAAMRWSAGLPVSGVANNPTPARIINLSLGGSSTCTEAYVQAISEVSAQGTLVVVSAGNDGGAVSSPANCSGVLGVAGIRHVGTKTGLSNMGPEIGLSAPSGNCVNTDSRLGCLFPIVVARNDGSTTPTTSSYTGAQEQSVGTSFSAPQVAAAAALVQSINSKLTPGQLITLLQETSTPFPINAALPQCTIASGAASNEGGECNCTTQTCGAGMLNAFAAVSAASRPLAVLHFTGTASIGSTIALDASDSFAADGHSLTAFQWSVTDAVGSAPVIAAPGEAKTSMQISAAGSFTLHLMVTDELGTEDSSNASFSTPVAAPAPATPVTPSSSNSGGGGGGALGWQLLALLVLAGGKRWITTRARAADCDRRA